MTARAPEEEAGQASEPEGFDSTKPSPARIWNYWVGGKDHFAADREAAAKIQEAMYPLPMPEVARVTRMLIKDVVHSLVMDHGIRQFLDIGTGLPTAENTHEIAQRAAPESRIVYADYDPSVLAHARALLVSTPEGKTDYIQADMRDTDVILTRAAKTLDFSKPIAVMFIAVLHFLKDSDDPWTVVRRIMDEVPPGSYLVIVHAPSDINPNQMEAGAQRYTETGAEILNPRTQPAILRFFDGLELIGPGLARMGAFLASEPADATEARVRDSAIAGIGKKPA